MIFLFFFLIFSRLTVRVRQLGLGFGLVWVYFIYFITQENPWIVLVTRWSDGSEITSCHFEASEITSSLADMLVNVINAVSLEKLQVCSLFHFHSNVYSQGLSAIF